MSVQDNLSLIIMHMYATAAAQVQHDHQDFSVVQIHGC